MESIPGMQVLEGTEPLRHLPSGSLVGVRVALKVDGGVGDSLIAIGGVSKRLDLQGAIVTAVVSERQQELMMEVEGVSHVATVSSFNDPTIRYDQDVFISFVSLFNHHKELRGHDYYDLVTQRSGIEASPGTFKNIKYSPSEGQKSTVCIHPSASNANRRWQDFKWEELAYQLRGRGFQVNFLGTRDEFGFTDINITKHSDEDVGLVAQIRELSHAHLFVGCDSGFAHVAGMLGVPGCVLFGNTSADHVIARYERLTGIDAYDVVGYGPTRSLRTDCEKSINAMSAIEVDEVLAGLNVYHLPYVSGKRRPKDAEKMIIAIVGVTDQQLIQRLKKLYDVHVYGNIPWDTTRFDAMLVVSNGSACVYRKGRSVGVLVSMTHEDIESALRQLTIDS